MVAPALSLCCCACCWPYSRCVGAADFGGSRWRRQRRRPDAEGQVQYALAPRTSFEGGLRTHVPPRASLWDILPSLRSHAGRPLIPRPPLSSGRAPLTPTALALALALEMDPLQAFPQEVVLKVLSHSPASSLLALSSVSQTWRALLEANSDPLWHEQAARAEEAGGEATKPRYGRPSVRTADLQTVLRSKQSPDEDAWEGVQTWKEYCECVRSQTVCVAATYTVP